MGDPLIQGVREPDCMCVSMRCAAMGAVRRLPDTRAAPMSYRRSKQIAVRSALVRMDPPSGSSAADPDA